MIYRRHAEALAIRCYLYFKKVIKNLYGKSTLQERDRRRIIQTITAHTTTTAELTRVRAYHKILTFLQATGWRDFVRTNTVKTYETFVLV